MFVNNFLRDCLYFVLIYPSLILSMTKQKNGLNSAHITSIVAMSLIAICCCIIAVELFKKDEVNQRETSNNAQKNLSSIAVVLGDVGLIGAFVCMCINLSDRPNGIELDHKFAIASLVLLLVLTLVPLLCCCADIAMAGAGGRGAAVLHGDQDRPEDRPPSYEEVVGSNLSNTISALSNNPTSQYHTFL